MSNNIVALHIKNANEKKVEYSFMNFRQKSKADRNIIRWYKVGAIETPDFEQTLNMYSRL